MSPNLDCHGIEMRRGSKLVSSVVLLMIAVAGGGCESLGMSSPSLPSFGGWFEEKKEPLPGARIAVLESDTTTAATASAEVKGAVVLPQPRINDSWSQPGGVPSNAPGHLALNGTLSKGWTADAGEGSSKSGRMVAVPIVADGKIFTLDAEGDVYAFSASGGSRIWHVSLRPDGEKGRSGYGGGLAAEGGRVYAATGYGTVVALDAGSGKVVWTKNLGIPFRTSPTVYNGKLLAVNSESQLYCLSTADGAELWNARGLPEAATMLSNVSPAVSGNLVVVPYSSGDLAAFDLNTGDPKWTDSIARAASAGSPLASISEPARPVIDGNVVFAVSRIGGVIATSKDTGSRLWTREITGSQTPYVAGDTVFVVDTGGKMVALTRKDGKIRWSTTLPSAKSWSGPVLAGGKLWVVSDKGLLVSLDAVSGSIETKADLQTPVSIAPVVANGKLYLLSDKARLIAMN